MTAKTDRELLELAAKAAGQERSAAGDLWSNARGELWNPLADDGDELRLAVKLGIGVSRNFDGKRAEASHRDLPWTFYEDLTRDDATRRAIVRAAAAIGEAKP